MPAFTPSLNINMREFQQTTHQHIRRMGAADMDRVVELCIEHARFERAPQIDQTGLRERLATALFAQPARLSGWVADVNEDVVGYATVTEEFSTWTGRTFWHMDCLYIQAHARNLGLGRELVDAIRAEARKQRVRELQWQTPAWNINAQRFYARLGATMQAKTRFRLDVGK
jgi:ribosomal protein S18 acetylase RimI-like enzyme